MSRRPQAKKLAAKSSGSLGKKGTVVKQSTIENLFKKGAGSEQFDDGITICTDCKKQVLLDEYSEHLSQCEKGEDVVVLGSAGEDILQTQDRRNSSPDPLTADLISQPSDRVLRQRAPNIALPDSSGPNDISNMSSGRGRQRQISVASGDTLQMELISEDDVSPETADGNVDSDEDFVEVASRRQHSKRKGPSQLERGKKRIRESEVQRERPPPRNRPADPEVEGDGLEVDDASADLTLRDLLRNGARTNSPRSRPASASTSTSSQASSTPATARLAKRKQTSLHGFLGIPDYRVPGYFYLDWRGQKATFCSDQPPRIEWKHEILWREQSRTIILCSDLASEDRNILHTLAGFPEDEQYTQKFIPLLKSHLQKCIRRNKGSLAARTAHHLAQVSLNEFLRRLPIIVVEDAVLHEKYPVLIWLMCAVSKGFYPPETLLKWVLGFVEAIGTGGPRDPMSSQPLEVPFKLDRKEVFELPNEVRDLIYALQLRKGYGGMRGDMVMLDTATQTWFERLSGPTPLQTNPFYPVLCYTIHSIAVENLEFVRCEEWELAAVDFHCTHILDAVRVLLRENDEKEWTEEDLRRVMWHKSSGVNLKQVIAIEGHLEGNRAEETAERSPRELERIWDRYASKIATIAKKLLRDTWATKDHHD